MTSKLDFEKPVPAPEDVSDELRSLLTRHDALVAEMRANDEEARAIYREQADERREDDRKTQVDSLIRGTAYEPPADVRDRLSKLARRRALINDALHELTQLINAERLAASRKVVDEFQPEQRSLATEFYRHLAAAVAVHAKFGEMRQRIERAGVNSASLHDFGKEIVGSPARRDDHAGYAFRDGVRRGYIGKADVPAGYL